MKISFKKISTISILYLIISSNIFAQKPVEIIPNFKFYKLNKTLFTNKDLISNTFSFFLFFDPNCDHCRLAIQKLNQHYLECSQTTIYLIVAIEDAPNMISFLNNYGPNLLNKKNIILLEDMQAEFIKKFHPTKYPSIFLYSKKNRLMLYDDKAEGVNKLIEMIKSNFRSVGYSKSFRKEIIV